MGESGSGKSTVARCIMSIYEPTIGEINYKGIIIRSLRCANYSLEAILHMLRQLSENPDTDIKVILNTPKQGSDIVSVCDRLIVSLSAAEKNAYKILSMLQDMKARFL